MNLLRKPFSAISSSRLWSGHLLLLNRMFCEKIPKNMDKIEYPLATQQEKSIKNKDESECEANDVKNEKEIEYEWVHPYEQLMKPQPIENERLDAYRIAVNMAEENNFRAGVEITSYHKVGFRLNKFIHVIGPVILFPKSVFQWKIEGPESITADSLSIVSLIEPKIQTLIISYSQNMGTADYVGRAMLEIAYRHKINVEVLPMDAACTQFNQFISDGRMVAAALIPPYNVVNEDVDAFDTMFLDGKQPTWDYVNVTMGEPKIKIPKRKK